MFAAPTRPRPTAASPTRSLAAGPTPSRREVRLALRRIGRHASLLRTIAAAPRPAGGCHAAAI